MVPDQPAPTDPAQRDRLAAKLVGHYAYYGITGNFMALHQYFRQVPKIWRKWLERRSRKKELPWAKFLPILARHPLPRPKIMQRYTAVSEALSHEEPDAVVLRVRNCGG